STTGTSAFSYGGLQVGLTQVLDPVLDDTNAQVGSRLTQTYVFTNPPTSTVQNFEVVRYIDGDLLFDTSLIDGGGRLFSGTTEYLFEIDSATDASTDTTLVAISGVGGTHPVTNRWEIDSYSGLRQRIGDGLALDGILTGDGADADQFIDAGQGYDVTLGLRNLYSLSPGQSGTYVATTIWGSIAPENIPEPTTLAVLGGAAALMLRRRNSR
ncbi:MAG TPA: PEP-CTERM sorting domain-containing protein, partial [Tepidisphaeraceae bacterium]|nr:PEP-CTERM sorting domain-containing protein [Tepidisphaeraceae bacterium]